MSIVIVVCVGCSESRPAQGSQCIEGQLASATAGGAELFVRPSHVPSGFKVEVFQDRGPRRVLLTGKQVSGVVPVVDLQLFAPNPSDETRSVPEIRQDASRKFSAKWDVQDRTILATAAYVQRDEFDLVLKSIELVDAAQFCAFVRAHDGRVFYS